MSAKRGRWLGEFVLIVIGVLAALAVDDLREARSDRALERHLLQGIRTDLARDSADILSARGAAEARAAGADELLSLLGDPDVGGVLGSTGGSLQQIPAMDNWAGLDDLLKEARARYPNGSFSARQALLMLAALQRFDLSDATYSEATASGELRVIQDPELRAAIATYYFDAGRFGNTIDERVEANAQRFDGVLAVAGLSAAGGGSDSAILDALRGDARLIAEIKNVRYFATFQANTHARVLASAQTLAETLDASIAPRR